MRNLGNPGGLAMISMLNDVGHWSVFGNDDPLLFTNSVVYRQRMYDFWMQLKFMVYEFSTEWWYAVVISHRYFKYFEINW